MDISKNIKLTEYISQLNIRVMDSGNAAVGPEWHAEQVCSPYSRLYLIHAGGGKLTHQDQIIQLKPLHIYLIPAGLTFDYACQTYMQQLYFHLHIYTADGYDLLNQLKRIYSLQITESHFHELKSSYNGHLLRDAFELHQHLNGLMTGFLGKARLSEQVIETASPFLRQVYALVQQSLNIKTTQKTLADSMSISVSALSKRFKVETGMSLGQYMDELLFQKTQQMLLFSDASLAQISEDLGFCDQFYFSRYFKQRQLETPSLYRRRLRKSI